MSIKYLMYSEPPKKEITKNDVLQFIGKYHNHNHCAIVTGVPFTEENIELIDAMKDVLGIAIHRRWRGPNWKWGYNTKDNAEKVSVYCRNRNIDVEVNSWTTNPDKISVYLTTKICKAIRNW